MLMCKYENKGRESSGCHPELVERSAAVVMLNLFQYLREGNID